MANLLPFKFGFKKNRDDNVLLKALTTGDDLHMDEQGRHLIFRTINGRVTPIRVSAEDFAEWLKNQNVNINPADQKTLREIDKELQIMERAAEYGGPALQKQYEEYFNQRRQLYTQLAYGYYQQALQNQAAANKMTVEQLQQAKQGIVDKTEGVSELRREQMDYKGWDSSFQMWVEGQDAANGLTPADDAWYYNRVYGAVLTALIQPASRGVPLSGINMDNVFSDEFFLAAMKLHYGEFFGGTGADPKKVVAAIDLLKKNYRENISNNKEVMSNFVNYWYKRMEEDFASETEQSLESSPVTDAVAEISEGVLPKELPENVTQGETRALLGIYSKARGSKLHAAHRVTLHAMSRLIESIPLQDRVSLAVELAHPKRGLHAVHREGYSRAFTDSTTLGLSYDRESLLRESLGLAESAAKGSVSQKTAALKRMSLLMGMMDGADVLEKNPGIQESNFNRRWHNSAVNAHRVRSEGPGILDVILDDENRASHTYTNQDLKLIHSPTPETSTPTIPEENPKGPLDLGDGYSFSGKKLLTPGGYSVEFSPTTQGHADIMVTSQDGRSFESRVYMPPIGISKMSEEDRVKYLDSLKGQLGFMIEDFEKSNPPVVKKDNIGDFDSEDLDFSEASFRVPLFTFSGRLNSDDSEFLSQITTLSTDANFTIETVADNIYKITNPGNKKSFTIMMSAAKKRLVGIEEDGTGSMVPHTEPTVEGFMHALGYRE